MVLQLGIHFLCNVLCKEVGVGGQVVAEERSPVCLCWPRLNTLKGDMVALVAKDADCCIKAPAVLMPL